MLLDRLTAGRSIDKLVQVARLDKLEELGAIQDAEREGVIYFQRPKARAKVVKKSHIYK